MKGDVGKFMSYRNGGLVDRLCFVAWKILQRRLVRKRIIEYNGERHWRNIPIARYSPPAKTAEKIVCLTGFGHSGSGAVADLLSEYQTTTVMSFKDRNGSGQYDGAESYEIDFLKAFNGVFSLERLFDATIRYPKYGDCEIRLFISLIADTVVKTGGIYGEEFLRLTREFVSSLIRAKRPVSYGFSACPHLERLGIGKEKLFWGEETNYLYTLRGLSREDYVRIAGDYICQLIRTIESNKFLVLDQAVSDGTADMNRYQSYLGPMKLIAVRRDPRDVYVTGRMLGEPWIPSDPDQFIDWYAGKNILAYAESRHPDLKLIWFEDLILNYKTVVGEIEEFLGLNSADHLLKGQFLTPSRSARNIGIYKTYSDQKAIGKITAAFSANELK